jgi:hypothetical protein
VKVLPPVTLAMASSRYFGLPPESQSAPGPRRRLDQFGLCRGGQQGNLDGNAGGAEP